MLGMAAEGLQDFVITDVRSIGGNALWVPIGEPHAGLQVAAYNARVVVDEEDDGQLVPHRRLHLHTIEAEGTVPVDADHRYRRPRQLGTHGEGHTDAHAAVGAG